MDTPKHEHRALAHSKAGDAAVGQQFSVQTVIVAARCWWKVATPVGLLFAICAAFGVYYFVQPKYTASAWIMIRERQDPVYRPFSVENPMKAIQNHLELLRSPTVVEPVVNTPAVAATPELRHDPMQSLRKQLKVRAVGRSDYYVIEFSSVSPEKSALVTNEITKAFLALHQRNESERTDSIVRLLKELSSKQQATVRSLRETVQELSKSVTGKGAFDVARPDDLAPQHNPIANLKSQVIAAEVDNLISKAQLQAEKEILEKQDFHVRQDDIEKFVAADSRAATLRTRLAQNRLKIIEHERTSTDLPRNVGYQQAQRQVADDQAALDKLLPELQVEAKAEIERQSRQHREDQLAALTHKLSSSDLTLDILHDKLKNELKNLTDSKGDALQLEFLRSDYDRALGVYNAIADRILVVETERGAPLRVETVRSADVPTFPDEAIPYKKMLIVSLGAFLLPFAIAVGVEFLYRRVSNREQLESGGNISVVGEITTLPTRGSSRQRSRRRSALEQQLFEESIDGLRTYLSLDDSLRGLKTLAVASAVSGEGKTSLASQLAVSLASATGAKTLLIDGDMRSPDIHQIFDIEQGPGLAEVLSGECTADAAIATGFSEFLHLLPAGVLASSPHRLLGNDAFANLLRELSETYTYVVIDTPPILPANEALVIARAADAAVLCVRRDYSRLWQVTTAYARLRAAGVKTAGAVLSGVSANVYAYRYGNYYYNRPLNKSGAPGDTPS